MTKNGICSKIIVNQNIKIVDYKGGVIMKNVIRILFVLVAILTIFSVTQPALAIESGESYGLDANLYNPNDAKDPNIDVDIIQKYVVPIYSLLQYALILAAIISLMIIGLKIIFGSTQQKAEYKQHLVPIVIGLCLAAFLFTFIRVLLDMAGIF